MPVFGEETFDLPIFKGLGITDRPTTDLCAQLTNMFMSAEKELRLREDLIGIQTLVKAPSLVIPVTSNIPRHYMETSVEIFTAVGSETTDSPSLLFFYDNGAVRDCTWLNTNSVTAVSYTQTLAANYGVKAFCQYRDRYYASNGVVGAGGKIFRIQNFTTAGGALTVTDCTGATTNIGVDILLTFKSRVFGFKKNRIYYTDLPIIGGYPETWNVNVNAIDLPSVDFDVTIYNALIYRDKIYMFTDKGIYVFNVSGSPTNWSIQLVSSNYPIYDRDSVCLNKNLIFLTDQQQVTMFDGSEFTSIGGNIRSLFHNYTTPYAWFNIYAWEEGIILCRNTFINTGGNYAVPTQTNVDKRVLYYNLAMWAEIEWFPTVCATLKCGRNLIPYRGKTASSWIYGIQGTNSQICFFYDGGLWKGDTMTTDHTSGGVRYRKPVALESSAPFLLDRSNKKYKFIDVYGYLNDVNTAGQILSMNGEPVSNLSDGQSIFRVPVDSTLGSQFKALTAAPLLISGTIDKSLSGDNYPPFLIMGADLVYNQDNRNRDGSGL